jgi:hypothetical protein
MIRSVALTLLCATTLGAQSDTIRLDIGSKDVDASYFQPHAARVRVYVKDKSGNERKRAEWLNILHHGDSAGKKVHRWTTIGTQLPESGDTIRWELRQTYDARTLAPYGIARLSSTGASSAFRIDGDAVTGWRTGWRQANPKAMREDVRFSVARPGYVASASDLVPLAAGLTAGKILLAPVWGPNMPESEMRVFTILGKSDVDVEGATVSAWKVEERRHADRELLATWWLIDKSPYMVYGYGEVPLRDGSLQRMTEVAVPMPRP